MERYEYSPFGERRVFVDSLAPSVHQVRVTSDELWVEVTEEVREEAIATAVGAGTLALVDVGSGDALPFVWEQTVTTGKQARRRLVLRVDPADAASWPTAGQDVELQVSAAALEDLFGNVASADYAVSLAWPSGDVVVEDTAVPRVEQVAVLDTGLLEVRLSEAVDLTAFGAELLVDGQPLTWVADVDGYAVRSDSPLAAGSYDVALGTGGIDLSGKGIDEAFSTSVNVSSGPGTTISAHLVYEESDPALVEMSTIGNRIGFHGLDADPVTGLVYARNRFYDSELGRFLTTDPMGYVDSPSLYQFAGSNPFNYRDPYGLCFFGLTDRTCWDSAKRSAASYWSFYKGSYQVAGELVVGVASLPINAWRADTARKRERMNAYLHGGYEAAEAVSRRHEAEMADNAKGLIPLVHTFREGSEIWSACESSASDCGLQIARTTVSAEMDAGAIYGTVKGARTLSTRYSSGPVLEGSFTETGQVAYGSTDLSAEAIAFRRGKNLTTRNVAVFEYQTASGEFRTITRASERGVGHAERIIKSELEAMGIDPSKVTRVYSELQPCVAPGGYCAQMLSSTYPEATVSYSFEYGDTQASRQAGTTALKEAAKAAVEKRH